MRWRVGLMVAVLAVAARGQGVAPEPVEDLVQRMLERRAAQVGRGAVPAVGVEPGVGAGPVVVAPVVVGTAPAGLPAASPVFTEAEWQELVRRLSSATFSEREGAQKELERFTWRSLEELKRRAAGVSDSEAAGRIGARIGAIEDRMAYDPPPISVELNRATSEQVVAALQAATGERFGKSPGTARGVYTLSARDKPFWEVFRELSGQSPMSVRALSGLFTIYPGTTATLNGIHGGLATFPSAVTRVTPAAAAVAAGAAGAGVVGAPARDYRFSYSLALDPRIKVVRSQVPRLLNMVDDAGNVLYRAPLGEGGSVTDSPQYRLMTGQTTFPIPDKPGQKIASATGEVRLMIQLASVSVDFDGVAQKLNEPFTIGSEKITVSQFESMGTSFRMRASRNAAGVPNAAPVTMALVDADNRALYVGGLSGSLSASVNTNNGRAPFKIRLTLTTRMREVTIPFEFRDLALPK